MDQQKVVVVLLLITIILSIVTVVLTLGVNLSDLTAGKSKTNLANPEDVYSIQSSNVALTVQPAGESG